MNPKQNRLVVLALLLCAAAFLTWRSMRSEAPTPGRVQSIEPQYTSPTRDTRPTINAAKAMTKTTALDAGWNHPERPIQFFNDPELAPSWVIKSGQEFWRSPATADKTENPAGADNSHFKHAELDRMSHVLVQNPVTGVAEIDFGNYYARADRDGLKFSPGRLATMQEDGAIEATGSKVDRTSFGSLQADPTTEILIRTLSIRRDNRTFYSADRDATSWSIIGNTAQARLSVNWGMTEHYQADNDGLAVTWIFPQPLPGSGSIEVTASIEGLTDAGETGPGHHFADRQGNARVRIGRAEAVDAAGTRWDLETQVTPDRKGQLIVKLPVEIQAEAVYPLAIDPVIGPEFGLDKPVVNNASDDEANAEVAGEERDPFPQGVTTSAQEPVIQFNTTAYSVHPGDTFAKVIVSLAGKYSGVVTVDFSTADKTARAGSDYLPVSWRLVFANNKTTIVVPIPILTGAQPNETVALKLQDPTGGAVLGAKQTATLKIN